MKKYIIWALALLMLPVSASAQRFTYEGADFQKNNTFVTAGAIFDFTGDDEKGRLLGAASIGGGIWIDKYLGFELAAVIGSSEFPTQVLNVDNKFKTYGVDLNYMAYILGANKFSRFNLIAALGVGFRQYNAIDNGVEGSYLSQGAINGHFGLQAVYNVTPKVGIYVEPMAVLHSKYYQIDNSDDLCGTTMLKVGATVTFNDKFKSMKIAPSRNYRNKHITSGNQMQTPKPAAEQSQANEAMPTATVVARPADANYLDLAFGLYETKLTGVEVNKIIEKCSSMADDYLVYNIVGFSEADAGESLSTVICTGRAEAIKDVLLNKCGIPARYVKIVTPDEVGFDSRQAGSLSTIVFIKK